METYVILTSESVDEILWCDQSNETFSAVLSHGTIYISQNEIWDSSSILMLSTLGSERVKGLIVNKHPAKSLFSHSRPRE